MIGQTLTGQLDAALIPRVWRITTHHQDGVGGTGLVHSRFDVHRVARDGECPAEECRAQEYPRRSNFHPSSMSGAARHPHI